MRRKKELRAQVSGLSECLEVCYLLKMNAEKQLGLWIMVGEKSQDEFSFGHIKISMKQPSRVGCWPLDYASGVHEKGLG